jgi:hypothetical protein
VIPNGPMGPPATLDPLGASALAPPGPAMARGAKPPAPPDLLKKEKADEWRSRIAASEKYRDTFLTKWKDNVRHRVQQPFSGVKDGDEPDRLSLPEDWARTKQKAAQLNYQMPKIVAVAKHPSYEDKAAAVTADLNDVLHYECQAAYMMDECLADVINAAGVMVSVIGLERHTEDVEIEMPGVPLVDPFGGLSPSMAPPEKLTVKKIVAQKFTWDRVSPADFLWPAEFRSSNWDNSPWLGVQQWMTVEGAKKTFEKLPADFEGGSERKPRGLTDDIDKLYVDADQYVRVTQIWYYAWLYDTDKYHPECIRRLVFVEGHDEPVEFDQTDWQEWVEEVPPQPAPPAPPPMPGQPPAPPPQEQPGRPGYYKGLRKLPIRVATLTYVSDKAIPPSDTEAGRPQVRELIRSRSQMLRQRDHSVPIRWYNVNLVDDEIAEALKRGEYQDIVPVNGDGSRMIGEVARANYPRESFQFQSIIGNDLDRAWSLSNNQLATQTDTERSATESKIVQGAGQIRLDYEKGRCNRFLVEGSEVLFSLMQKFRAGTKYVRVPKLGGEELTAVEPADLLGEFQFDIVADSSDRVDITTRQANTLKLYNLLANSKSVDRQQLERELITLHGHDPTKIIRKEPPAEKPEAPNVSYRFSGEDLLNPMAVALLLKTGVQLTPQDIKAAAMMIQDAVGQMMTRHLVPGQPGQPGGAQPGGPGAGGPMAGPAGGPPSPNGGPPVTPPEMNEPILKRAGDGSRFM